MNSTRGIIFILMMGLALLVAVLITVTIFTSGGNLIGSSFRYFLPLAIILGFTYRKPAFFALIAISPFIDLIKRFMILDQYMSDMDIALVLAVPPGLMFGLVVRTVVDAVFRRNPENQRLLKGMIITGIIAAVASVGMLGSSLAGYSVLRSIGEAVNTGAYFLLIPILPTLFKTRKELMTVCAYIILLYLIPSVWCIKQGIWGLAKFEMDYILSGYTIEIRQLNEKVFRNMGTMGAAAALSCVVGMMVAGLLMPLSFRKGTLSILAPLHPARLIPLMIMVVAMYYTYTRTPWVLILVALITFWCLRFKLLGYIAPVIATVGITLLYLNAQTILDQQLLNKWQVQLDKQYGGDAGLEQTMVLATYNGRLESMAGLMSNRGHIWTPFGKWLEPSTAGSEESIGGHDIVSELMGRCGFVGLFFIIVFSAVFTVRALRLNFRLVPCPERNFARLFLSLGFAILCAGFSHGAQLSTFPTNLFLAFYLAVAWHQFDQAKQITRASRLALAPTEPLGLPLPTQAAAAVSARRKRLVIGSNRRHFVPSGEPLHNPTAPYNPT